MKVYAKRTIQNSFVLNIIALFVMGLFTIAMPIYTIKLLLDGDIGFIGGIVLSAVIIFGDQGMFLGKGKQRMTLTRKDMEIYKRKEICQMLFVSSNANEKKTYKYLYCYTKGNNDLELNKDYLVTINFFTGLANRIDNI